MQPPCAERLRVNQAASIHVGRSVLKLLPKGVYNLVKGIYLVKTEGTKRHVTFPSVLDIKQAMRAKTDLDRTQVVIAAKAAEETAKSVQAASPTKEGQFEFDCTGHRPYASLIDGTSNWTLSILPTMPTFKCTIQPAGVTQIHELLTCLARFDENVSLEAYPQKLCFSSLNISKTAHASFTLGATSFFAAYQCSGAHPNPAYTTDQALWTCRLQNRALISIFKKRVAENRDKDTALERCEIELKAHPNETECRLVIRLICHHGVVKTYRLTYESAEVLHASFDRGRSDNQWTISSKTLRDVVEYFGPKTDQLDWYYHDDKVTFTSYTEKIQSGREILKQPMHTSVALERKDFDDFNVQQGLHIGIVVKDFRAIVAHAETMRVSVTARYSRGNRPMQIAYDLHGILGEFTLMTRSHSNDVPSGSTASTPFRDLSVRPISQDRGYQRAASIPATTQSVLTMPPPRKMVQDEVRSRQYSPPTGVMDKSEPIASVSIDPDSMFVPGNDDQHWDEPTYDEEPDFVMYDNAPDLLSTSISSRRIQDSETTSFRSNPARRLVDDEGIAPTQRLSQVRGLFD